MDSTADPGASPDGGIEVAGRTLEGTAPIVAFAIVVAFVGLAVSQVLPLVFFLALRAAGSGLPVLVAVTVQLVLTEVVGFGGSTWFYLRLRSLSADYVHVRRPTLRDLGWMVGGTATVVVLYFGVVVTAVLAGVPMARSGISIAGESEPTILLVLAVLSFVLIGPMEELFFRGVVQETMGETLPRTTAVVLASLVFAVIHYLTLVGPLAGKVVLLASMFVTALVLGFAYERTRNLLVNAVIHGGYNATLLVLAYLVFRSGLA